MAVSKKKVKEPSFDLLPVDFGYELRRIPSSQIDPTVRMETLKKNVEKFIERFDELLKKGHMEISEEDSANKKQIPDMAVLLQNMNHATMIVRVLFLF